jgi:SAM-dependent methyltransferase
MVERRAGVEECAPAPWLRPWSIICPRSCSGGYETHYIVSGMGRRDALMTDGRFESYFATLTRDEHLWSSEAALRRYTWWLFQDVPLQGARVLDIGGGVGVFSFYAAAAGAGEVLCLEPEGQGGSIGMNEQFHRLQRLTGFHNVRLEHAMLQTFEPTPASFDVVLLHNSVNHLDEAMVPLLRRDAAAGEDARDVYRWLFRRLADALVPAGHLVLTDCARDNLFPRLGLRHPLLPQIEWDKHQNPAVWWTLLRQTGFERRSERWSSFNRLGALGWMLLANRAGAFFFTGHFRLHAQRSAHQVLLKPHA